jgi:hypothetical protein
MRQAVKGNLGTIPGWELWCSTSRGWSETAGWERDGSTAPQSLSARQQHVSGVTLLQLDFN